MDINIESAAEVAQVVEHGTENAGVASSTLALGTGIPAICGTGNCDRKWLSGRASPCQGEGRGFESHLPVHNLGII